MGYRVRVRVKNKFNDELPESWLETDHVFTSRKKAKQFADQFGSWLLAKETEIVEVDE